jgi:predicted lipoprotein with Yx(FWY)xxD motif
MIRRSPVLLAIVAIAVGAAACSPAATTAPTSAPATTAPATAAPSTAAPTTAAPATSAPTAAAGGATVNAQSVGTAGTILVDGKTGKTLYMFTQDVKGSGKSNCTGGCLTTWPALTVAAGATPTGGSGVTGTLATITRDDGTLQVTYNGQPLYFFKNDQAPGDLNGVYASWETVAP